MIAVTWDEIGEIAYKAFNNTVGGLNFNADYMGEWDELPDELKEEWTNIARKSALHRSRKNRS